VILVVDTNLTTLLDFSYQKHHYAERGQHGGGKDMTGRSGKDMVLKVPPGTVVTDADTGELLGELLEEGQRMVVAKGGRGGKGNAHFPTATNQAPRHWQVGEEGEERRIQLELKLIADVGLVGEPNAGKSTLLSTVTVAQPKVADYPFTTLIPNLGVVRLSGYRSFVLADIPGIIEGAHEGKGLGHQFLRHIERTRTLALMVSVEAADVQAEYESLRAELEAYSRNLARTPHCVVLTKTDLLGPDDPLPVVEAPNAFGVFGLSSVARRGIQELLEALWARSRAVERAEKGEDEEEWWTP
jgi:GTP-binding protein